MVSLADLSKGDRCDVEGSSDEVARSWARGDAPISDRVPASEFGSASGEVQSTLQRSGKIQVEPEQAGVSPFCLLLTMIS